jgi:hypothetical protein
MADYYVNDNAQSNGDHEVHVAGCQWMPKNRTSLGNYSSCRPAVAAAKRIYSQSNGCYYCSRDCHTT